MAQASAIRVAIAALIGNAALAAAKFVVAGVSGSGAMFAEAVHSTVDAGNEALLLLGLQRSERPAATRHQLGHGKEIYFWSLAVAVLVFGIGAGVSVSKGFDTLDQPQTLMHLGWVYFVLALALLFQLGSALVVWRALGETRAGRPLLAALREGRDPVLFPLIIADTAGLAGLVVALVGIVCADRLGWLWADGAAALLIGAILAVAAVLLLVETRGLLIGTAAEPHLVEDIIGVAGRARFVHAVNEVRTMQAGPSDVLVNLSVDARDDFAAGEVEAGVAALEAEIKSRHPAISRVFIEIQSAEASRAPEGAPGVA